jgi:hypothetical protein
VNLPGLTDSIVPRCPGLPVWLNVWPGSLQHDRTYFHRRAGPDHSATRWRLTGGQVDVGDVPQLGQAAEKRDPLRDRGLVLLGGERGADYRAGYAEPGLVAQFCALADCTRGLRHGTLTERFELFLADPVQVLVEFVPRRHGHSVPSMPELTGVDAGPVST